MREYDLKPGNDNKGFLPHTRRMRPGIVDAASVDGNGWVASKTLVAYGVRIGIRTNKPEFLDRLLTSLTAVWRPSPALTVERWFSLRVGTAGIRRNGRTLHQLFEDQQLVSMARNPEEALEMIESQL